MELAAPSVYCMQIRYVASAQASFCRLCVLHTRINPQCWGSYFTSTHRLVIKASALCNNQDAMCRWQWRGGRKVNFFLHSIWGRDPPSHHVFRHTSGETLSSSSFEKLKGILSQFHCQFILHLCKWNIYGSVRWASDGSRGSIQMHAMGSVRRAVQTIL